MGHEPTEERQMWSHYEVLDQLPKEESLKMVRNAFRFKLLLFFIIRLILVTVNSSLDSMGDGTRHLTCLIRDSLTMKTLQGILSVCSIL